MTENYQVIHLEGLLDIGRYPEFRFAFERLPATAVLLDLTDAESADSTFLSEMLMAKRRHPAPFVVLIAPSGNIARLFAIADLGAKMRVFTDRDEAIASLNRTEEPGGVR